MKKLSIKLTRTQFQHLYELYVNVIPELPTANDHFRLIAEHTTLQARTMRKTIVNSDSPKLALKMDRAECLAFILLWSKLPVPGDYFLSLIRDILAQADKYLKQPQNTDLT